MDASVDSLKMKIWSLAGFTLLCTACSDYDINRIDDVELGGDSGSPPVEASVPNEEPVEEDDCVEEVSGFDIEEVSLLQDAAGYSNMRDAIIMSFDDSELSADDSWRVSSVDVLIMLPQWSFDFYGDDLEITAEVFDSADPRTGDSWSVRQVVVRDQLQWESITLPSDAATAGQWGEYEQYGAWMTFDFKDVIPEEGMTSTDYVVGVRWNVWGIPAVGYSNFNLDCSTNWTDYGDQNWVLNQGQNSQYECSWPMFRLQIETRQTEDCE